MKKNISFNFNAVLFGVGLLSSSFIVSAADNEMNVGGIQLCGSFASAVEFLKNKGFFQGYTPARLDQTVKSGVIPAMKRGNEGHIKYFVQNKNGKVIQVSYDARQYANAASEAAVAKEMASRVTAMTPHCVGNPQKGVELCNYAQGETQISVRTVKSPASVRVFAKSNCK